MTVLVCVSGLTVHCGGEMISISGDQDIQERYLTILLFLDGELNVWG